jgi:hypothetical protein
MGSQQAAISGNGPVDPQAIPECAIDHLAKSLVQIVQRYFENPEVQSAFEEWKCAKEATK